MKAEKASSIKDYIAHKSGFINNYGGHELVKIWLCWDSNTIDIKVNQSSDPVIHCAIIVVEGQSYFASFIYGFLIVVLLGGRHGRMIFVASSISLAKKNWVLGADFNKRERERVIGSSYWLDGFPQAGVDFILNSVSDHATIYVFLQAKVNSEPETFKFFVF